MSRDRLRDIRANANQSPVGGGQQQQYSNDNGGGQGYAQQTNYSAPIQQNYQEQQHPFQNQQNQQQQQSNDNNYQMQNMNNGNGNDMASFFAEVASIQDEIKLLHSNINSVSDLHSRRLATTDDSQQQQSANDLSNLTNQTSNLTNSIRNRILKLNNFNKSTPTNVGGEGDFNIRKTQISGLQNGFKRALEEYNLVEKRSRDKYRQRMERQIRIVKPDATQEEIKAAFDDQQGGQQIFSQALVQSRQSGARAAFAEVQTRNQDLRKIEETITQLAQMMQDMATLVLEQDESVQRVEQAAATTSTDVEAGLKQTQKAVKSARAARTKRWICFGVIVVILIVIGVVVAVEVVKNQKK